MFGTGAGSQGQALDQRGGGGGDASVGQDTVQCSRICLKVGLKGCFSGISGSGATRLGENGSLMWLAFGQGISYRLFSLVYRLLGRKRRGEEEEEDRAGGQKPRSESSGVRSREPKKNGHTSCR